jgi:hypothetical protein
MVMRILIRQPSEFNMKFESILPYLRAQTLAEHAFEAEFRVGAGNRLDFGREPLKPLF